MSIPLSTGGILPVLLRPFKKEDNTQVMEIEGESFSDAWPSSFFSYLHNKAPDLFIVAEENGRIIGYIVGEVREIMLSGLSYMSRMGHILNIAVDKEMRKRGVGTLLMQRMEAIFREGNASRATLEVRESNANARTFYHDLGYREIGRVQAYYQDEDAIIMGKPL
jgi:ribosomal-protein-alanine N-acetyltransferase